MEALNLGLTDQSSTLPSDLYTGYQRTESGGKVYVLCKAAATINDGYAVKKDTTSSTDMTVILSAAVQDACIGINNTGASITSGNYFWALRSGRGYADGTLGWSDGDKIGPTATGGQLDTAAALSTIVGIAIVDSSGTPSANAILFQFPGTANAAS